MDEVLEEKKEVAKEYMITNNRNWGKMSAMMLATETQDREIIAHDLCWKVIGKIWRNGKMRQQVCYVVYNRCSKLLYGLQFQRTV